MEPHSRPLRNPPTISITPTTIRPQPRITDTSADALSGLNASRAPQTIIKIEPLRERFITFQLIPFKWISSFP